jgi:hypothetical protein
MPFVHTWPVEKTFDIWPGKNLWRAPDWNALYGIQLEGRPPPDDIIADREQHIAQLRQGWIPSDEDYVQKLLEIGTSVSLIQMPPVRLSSSGEQTAFRPGLVATANTPPCRDSGARSSIVDAARGAAPPAVGAPTPGWGRSG